MMPYRQDPATAEEVLVARIRSSRPDVHAVEGCPFCPGQERHTPPELTRLRSARPDGGWQIRVVPNRFPLVSGDDGRHEVVVESPHHDWDYAHATAADMTAVLHMLRSRSQAAATAQARAVLPFRNRRAAAGESIGHPHSQLVWLTRVPEALERRWQLARTSASPRTSLQLQLAERARDEGVLLVLADHDVVAFQPAAAKGPYEVWLVPLRSGSDFATADDDVLEAVGAALQRLCAGLFAVLGDVAYNVVFRSGPPRVDARDWWRWHVTVHPRTTVPGGFELGSGLAVNPLPPEDTAPVLRAAVSQAVT